MEAACVSMGRTQTNSATAAPVGRAARDQVRHPPLSGGHLAAGPFGGCPRRLSFDLGQQRPVSHRVSQFVRADQRVAGRPPDPAPPPGQAQHQRAAGQLRTQRR